jgi:hypothetical protein
MGKTILCSSITLRNLCVDQSENTITTERWAPFAVRSFSQLMYFLNIVCILCHLLFRTRPSVSFVDFWLMCSLYSNSSTAEEANPSDNRISIHCYSVLSKCWLTKTIIIHSYISIAPTPSGGGKQHTPSITWPESRHVGKSAEHKWQPLTHFNTSFLNPH